MCLKKFLRKIKKNIRVYLFRLQNLKKEKFTCPVCKYTGPFMDVKTSAGLRKHAICAACGALERHRLQFLVFQIVLDKLNTSKMSMLHFAPEEFYREYFKKKFKKYKTADLYEKNVDYKVDIRNIPFPDSSFNLVFGSHILEHIPDDIKAIKEIRRILKPGGIAIFPVPIFGEKTVEYPEPNPNEGYHVRAPGEDYFERFEAFFSKVERYASYSFPEKFQVFVYEDRSKWPIDKFPLRPCMKGERHIDFVPVCYV